MSLIVLYVCHRKGEYISLELFYFAADRLGTDRSLNPSSLVSLSFSFYASFTRRGSCFYSEHALSKVFHVAWPRHERTKGEGEQD